MDLGLKDCVIVVTGGGSGIGAATSRACLDEGARVVVVSRAEPTVTEFMAAMDRDQRPCVFVETELSDVAQCRRAVQYVQDKFGRMDGLVNNASLNDGVGLASGDPERFLNSLRQNLVHYYAMAHYALPMLKEAQGAIVNVGSKVAMTGQGGTSGYAAVKGAQLALTREWAVELLPFNVRVNAVIPAEVLTPAYTTWLSSREDPEAALKNITRKIPLGRRMTQPAEIAATILFLLSAKQSGHTTGQHVVVDGGYTHLDRALT